MYIIVRNNDVGKALRILKKKLLQEGVSKELRETDRRQIKEKSGIQINFKCKI